MKKQVCLYAAIFCLALLYALCLGEYGGYVVFLLVLVFPPLEMFLFWLLMRGRVEAKYHIPVYLWEQGEQTVIRIELINHSGWIPVLQGKIRLEMRNEFMSHREEVECPFDLEREGRREFSPECYPRYPGIYKIRVKAVLYDFLGICPVHADGMDWEEFTIMPCSMELSEINLNRMEAEGESDIFSRIQTGSDSSELFQIRPYEPGDKRNRVHWKLSSRYQELMVKDYGFPLECNTAVFLDFSWGSRYEEKYRKCVQTQLEVALYLCQSLVEQNMLFYLVWYHAPEKRVLRRMVEREEDIFFVFQQVFSSRIYEGSLTLSRAYHLQYGKDRLVQVCYLGTETSLGEKDTLQAYLATEHLQIIAAKG